MYKKINKYQSDVHVYEFNPLENPSQIVKSSNRRQTLDKFQHKWFLDRGYKQQCVINLGFFHMANPDSIHMGLLARDGGFVEGVPNNGMECWLEKDGTFNVAQLNNAGAKGIGENWHWGTSLAYSLVINGKKRIEGTKGFNTTSKTDRTAIGQKADKTMVLVVADSLTCNELADVMISLGCINAINGDGGGSSQMIVNDKYVKQSGRAIGTALIVFVKDEHQKEDLPVKKKLPIVVCDPGHGGADPGAVANGFGLREKDLTLTISKHIEYFITRDYEVDFRLTRDIDKTMNLSERTDYANKVGADYLASVHINAGGGAGYEDFIYITLSDSSKTAAMRIMLHAEIKKVLEKYNINNRGMKKANFHMLRETNMPAVLTENLFIDNANDQKLLKNENFLRDIAAAHSNGIARALGLTKKVKPEPVKPTPDPKVGGQPGLHRIIADGKQIGAWGEMSYLLRNVEKAIDSGTKEIKIERVN